MPLLLRVMIHDIYRNHATRYCGHQDADTGRIQIVQVTAIDEEHEMSDDQSLPSRVNYSTIPLRV